MRPKRVLFVINNLLRGGAETQLVRLAVSLPRDRWRAQIAILKRSNAFAEELRSAEIPVATMDRRGPWDARVVQRLLRLMTRERPDIVHTYLFFASLLGVPAARMTGAPAVVVSQRSSYEAGVAPFWRWVARRLHRNADKVIVNSRAAVLEEEAAGVPAERLLYVPNGISAWAEPHCERAALGLPPGPLALCVGQLTKEKGHRHLIQAWSDVRRGQPRATLALAGDGPLRGDLEAAAREARIGDAVLFLGPRDDVPRLIASADLVVLASLTEGMPNAILEAMAAGRAVVATRVGGIPDLVIDRETGILVPRAEPAALAAAIMALLDDPSRRARLGEAGRRRAREHFSMEKVTGAVVAVYEALLGLEPEATVAPQRLVSGSPARVEEPPAP